MGHGQQDRGLIDEESVFQSSQRGSLDCVPAQLATVRRFRVLDSVVEVTREGLLAVLDTLGLGRQTDDERQRESCPERSRRGRRTDLGRGAGMIG